MNISYKIIAIDIALNQETFESFYFFYGTTTTTTPSESLPHSNGQEILTDLFQILILVISLFFFPLIFSIVAKRKYQNRKREKFEIKKELLTRFDDILNIRAIIFQNRNGLAIYSENFLTMDQDLDLTAGLTSAFSSLVSELSQQDLKSGQFDLLEREGFGIISHHKEYSTISVVSSGKLSDYTKEKISELHDSLEEKFNQQDLEGYHIGKISKESGKLVNDHLSLGYLRLLSFDYDLFNDHRIQFKESERKIAEYVQRTPSLTDGKIIFYIRTFISNLALYGISTYEIYSFLDRCYQLKIIDSVSDEEKNFLGLNHK